MRRQSGFTYLVALGLIAILAIVGTRLAEDSALTQRQEQEAALLYIGLAYQRAIGDYYRLTPGTLKRYPPTLDALLQDDRLVRLQRHLRRPYRDPIQPTLAWGLIPAPDGGIAGVYSQAPGKPLKTGGFPSDLTAFTAASRYADWRFIYVPPPEPPQS
ncbi:MAG: type II secretion system protein [Elusimicrobia bacterium]|nr:MAG: type II secretion system protein [Elusimicrobiota bacterium]